MQNNNEDKNKEKLKNKEEEIKKVLDDMLSQGLDDISLDDINSLKELLENTIQKKPKRNIFKSILIFIGKCILCLLVAFACYGLLSSFINSSVWYYSLIYLGGLSLVINIIDAITKKIVRIRFNPVLRVIIKLVITITVGIILNYLNLPILKFDGNGVLIFYYLLVNIIIYQVYYCIMKFTMFR